MQQLASPNIWWRRTAQRLLVDRGSADAVEPLTTLFASSQSAVARLHALWTLDGLSRLETSLIEKALEDPEAGVRENAILLAEPRLSGSPTLIEKLLKMERDPDRRVQFQLLCDAGRHRLARLARRAGPPAGAGHRRSVDADRRAQRLLGSGATAIPHRRRIHGQADQRPRHLLSPDLHGDRRAAEDRRDSPGADDCRSASVASPGSSWWRAAASMGSRRVSARVSRGVARRTTLRAASDLGQDLLLKLFESPDADVRRASLRVPDGDRTAAAMRLRFCARAAATAQDAEPGSGLARRLDRTARARRSAGT